MIKTQYNNERGQALLFVVVAMTIALTIGINASVRTITSLSRTSRTDTANRALAAAEGGIERYLEMNTQQLKETTDIPTNGCPAGNPVEEPTGSGEYYCRIDFNTTDDTSKEFLTSQALVQVEAFIPQPYVFTLEAGQVKEVNLVDISLPDSDPNYYYDSDSDSDGETDIKICWSPQVPAGDPGSDLYYIAYDQNGITVAGGLASPDNPPGGGYNNSGFTVANDSEVDGYDNCIDVVNLGEVNVYGLRIRSLGADSQIAVYSTDEANDPLKLQGYRISSLGRISEDIGVTATRVISIVRTLPYLPGAFDYAIYSQNSISLD